MLACALAGCGFSATTGAAIDASDGAPMVIDAPTDAGIFDAVTFDVDPTLCIGPNNSFLVCLPPPGPIAQLTLSGTIDTTMCTAGFLLSIGGGGAPDLCVVSGTNITASGTVRVTGSNPLAIVATQNITIPSGATIDVSSVVGGSTGAGANTGSCSPGSAATGNSGGGGGGAGGTFQTLGGRGGAGQSTVGGGLGTIVTASFVRGGCRGGNGAGSSPGIGGSSGGAVYLAARLLLQIDGRINATGAGGRGATGSKSGGGGGGSGGMIALHGAQIVIGSGARIWANGGGGGGGGSSNSAGTNGDQAPDPGGGGAGGSGDGAGGVGAYGINGGAAGTQGGKGGGGGGGGGGVVDNVTGSSLAPGEISPPAI